MRNHNGIKAPTSGMSADELAIGRPLSQSALVPAVGQDHSRGSIVGSV